MFVEDIVTFGRGLRRRGLDVSPGRVIDVIEALNHVDVRVRDDVYHVCRALFVHHREDLMVFDRAFDAFWQRTLNARRDERTAGDRPAGETDPARGRAGHDGPADATAGPDADTGQGVAVTRTWSNVARLATKDFADFTGDEIRLAELALERLTWNPGRRRTRRWVRGIGARLDIRRAMHSSIRTGGDLARLPRRQRRLRDRPVVLVCDVSGSMERYSRMLLHFAHALARRHRQVETFVFSTRLTRITADLASPNLDAALAAASRSVTDWSGGTRIGEALRALRGPAMRHRLRRGPVVLIVSDGWDRGDPALLRDEMARLRRRCHRLIWLNPLIGTIDYAPLTRGLRAALPFVDHFLPARTLANLADIAAHLNGVTSGARRRPSNAEPRARNPHPRTRNPHPEPGTQNPNLEPRTSNPEP